MSVYEDITQAIEEAMLQNKPLNAFRVQEYSEIREPVYRLTSSAMTIFDEIFKLFDKMEAIGDNNYKQAWVTVPRGDVKDCGFSTLTEARQYFGVKSNKQLQKAYEEEFPQEQYWYQISSAQYEKVRVLQLGNLTIVIGKEYTDKKDWTAYKLRDILIWIFVSLRKVIRECKAGTYNDRISRDLPYSLRYGVIGRKELWDHNPEYRESNLKDLSKEEIEKFIEVLKSEDGTIPTKRIKVMTFNRYFEYAALSFKNAGLQVDGMTPFQQFNVYGEDFGGTVFRDVDFDSPEDFVRFYNGELDMAGHPWGLYRGSSRSRIMLRPHLDDEGYYFSFSSDPNWSVYEMVKMYLPLKEAGLPVVFSMPQETIEYLREEDKVGFVMSTELCVYRQRDFKEPINDFYHFHEEDEPIKHLVEWYPVEQVVLKKETI